MQPAPTPVSELRNLLQELVLVEGAYSPQQDSRLPLVVVTSWVTPLRRMLALVEVHS